jgi:hypothetical protein
MHTVDNIVIYGVHTARLRRGQWGMRCGTAVEAGNRGNEAKGFRRSEAHEPGKVPKEQDSAFPLEGTHSTNPPAKARRVSTDSNGNAAHHIARHVTLSHSQARQNVTGMLNPAL